MFGVRLAVGLDRPRIFLVKTATGRVQNDHAFFVKPQSNFAIKKSLRCATHTTTNATHSG
jgi:hypothetical protein